MEHKQSISLFTKVISVLIFIESVLLIVITVIILFEFFASILFYGGASSAYGPPGEAFSNPQHLFVGIVSLILFILAISGFFIGGSLRKNIKSSKLWPIIFLIFTSLGFFILVKFLFEKKIDFLINSSYFLIGINILIILYLIFEKFSKRKQIS